jgi:BirA family biotin operon repressor/biotin-[acetyl-CoA-carboxylase] ligase
MFGPIDVVSEVDSTNRTLLERARRGAPEGIVLVAAHQTAGRGRLGRTWESLPGSALLVSVLLRPDLPIARAHLLTFAAGIAARDACELVAGCRPCLKWPNDLIVESGESTRKLAGLLAESVVDGSKLTAVVVGMGLNLRPGGVPEGGVGLDELAGAQVDRDELLRVWLDRFEVWLAALGTDELLDAYRAASATLGREVLVTLPGSSYRGRAVDIGPDGQLVVEVAGGRRSVVAGDVEHLSNV